MRVHTYFAPFLALPVLISGLPEGIRVEITFSDDQPALPKHVTPIFPHSQPQSSVRLQRPIGLPSSQSQGKEPVPFDFDELEIGDIFEPIPVGPFILLSGSILDLDVFPNIKELTGSRKAWVTADESSLLLKIKAKTAYNLTLTAGFINLDERQEAFFAESEATLSYNTSKSANFTQGYRDRLWPDNPPQVELFPKHAGGTLDTVNITFLQLDEEGHGVESEPGSFGIVTTLFGYPE